MRTIDERGGHALDAEKLAELALVPECWIDRDCAARALALRAGIDVDTDKARARMAEEWLDGLARHGLLLVKDGQVCLLNAEQRRQITEARTAVPEHRDRTVKIAVTEIDGSVRWLPWRTEETDAEIRRIDGERRAANRAALRAAIGE